jgi:hypothetical protein
MKFILSSALLLFVIVCGNANAQNYLGKHFNTEGDATCSKTMTNFNYVIDGTCVTYGSPYPDGSVKYVMGASKVTAKHYAVTDLDCSGDVAKTTEVKLKCNVQKFGNTTNSNSQSSASSMPAGHWLITKTYGDDKCSNLQQVQGTAGGDCYAKSAASSQMFKEESGKYNLYTYENKDCSGTGKKGMISYEKDKCVPFLKAYAKYTIEKINAVSSSTVASFNAFMVFALIILSTTLQ